MEDGRKQMFFQYFYFLQLLPAKKHDTDSG